MTSILADDEAICGGGIIDNFFVLSAAHCFTDATNAEFKNHKYSVVAGVIDLKDNTKFQVEVKDVYIPEGYTPLIIYTDHGNTATNDIAVIKVINFISII